MLAELTTLAARKFTEARLRAQGSIADFHEAMRAISNTEEGLGHPIAPSPEISATLLKGSEHLNKASYLTLLRIEENAAIARENVLQHAMGKLDELAGKARQARVSAEQELSSKLSKSWGAERWITIIVVPFVVFLSLVAIAEGPRSDEWGEFGVGMMIWTSCFSVVAIPVALLIVGVVARNQRRLDATAVKESKSSAVETDLAKIHDYQQAFRSQVTRVPRRGGRVARVC